MAGVKGLWAMVDFSLDGYRLVVMPMLTKKAQTEAKAKTEQAKAKDNPDYSALWKKPKPTKPRKARERCHRNRIYFGPLVGDTM
jgi:hypothetical protein